MNRKRKERTNSLFIQECEVFRMIGANARGFFTGLAAGISRVRANGDITVAEGGRLSGGRKRLP